MEKGSSFNQLTFIEYFNLWLDYRAFNEVKKIEWRVHQFKELQDMRIRSGREFPTHAKVLRRINEVKYIQSVGRVFRNANVSVRDISKARRPFSESGHEIGGGLWDSTNEPIVIITENGNPPKIEILDSEIMNRVETKITYPFYVDPKSLVPRSDA